jgi:hypothetical protein
MGFGMMAPSMQQAIKLQVVLAHFVLAETVNIIWPNQHQFTRITQLSLCA